MPRKRLLLQAGADNGVGSWTRRMMKLLLVRPPASVELLEASAFVAAVAGGVNCAIVRVVDGADRVIIVGRVLILGRATYTCSCGDDRERWLQRCLEGIYYKDEG